MHLPSVRHAASLFAVLALSVSASCGGSDATGPSNPATETFASSLGVNIAAMTELSPDLYVQDLVTGTGAVVAAGHRITVAYTGWLANGTQFDTSNSFPFTIGVQQVIPGWDEGLIGMHVGGKRLLVIGSRLGYGSGGNGPIPPNATLVFTVQVISEQ